MSIHEHYMCLAISLALKAEGRTSPNPIVGAVVAKRRKIIGKGYHKGPGLPHAEMNALRRAGRLAKGADLYVTLEPCDHFGRTPPCTDAIIKSGIKNVFIGMKDPNPINNGRGMRKLRRHGIAVRAGILAEEARSINRPYIKFITTKMPYVTVKVAESLDGKIATKTGDSRWLTSEDSRRYVHRLRSKSDAVMVGVNTVIKDDPLLTNRVSKGRQPVRVIVDSRLHTPLGARIFSDIKRSPVFIAATGNSPRMKYYEAKGAKVLIVKSKGGMVDLKELLKLLGRMEIADMMVEGGGELVASIIEGGLADKLLFFLAPKVIGGRRAITSVEGKGVTKMKEAVMLKNLRIKRFKVDILIEAETK